jgi:hypothetical protein
MLRRSTLGMGQPENGRWLVCCPLPQSCPGWQLHRAGRGGEGQGGGLPSCKRPCLIVPD